MPGEGARGQNGMAIVICMAPDVCKTPTAPVPYPIVAMFSLSSNTKPTVIFASEPAFTSDSFIQQVLGDEAGVGMGVKSGTFKSAAKPIESSATVKAKGKNVVRNGDKFEMNEGNTQGILVFIMMGPANISPDGPTAENNPPLEPETEEEAGFLKGLTDRGGEVVDDVKGMGGTLWDAVGGGDQSGDFANAWGNIWEGTKATGSLVKDVAVAGAGKAAGLDNLPTDWQPEIYTGAKDQLSNVGSAIWDDVKGGYVDAYNEGGLSQAAGRGLADVGKLAIEILGAKGAGAVVKGVQTAKTAAKAVDKVADVAEDLAAAAKATDKATDAAKTANKTPDVKKPAKGSAAGGSESDKVLISKAPGPDFDGFVSEHAKKHKYDPDSKSTKRKTQYGKDVDPKDVAKETMSNPDKVTHYDGSGNVVSADQAAITKYEKTFSDNISTSDTPTNESRVFINHVNPDKSSQFPYYNPISN